MENVKLQIARRRNRQKREGVSFFQKLSGIFGQDATVVELLEADASVVFEQHLFAAIREGLKSGSIKRRMGVTGDQLESALTTALSCLPSGHVIVAPVNAMDFTFVLSHPPNPRQLRELVIMDGDSVFVVTHNLLSGVGLDCYESETREEMCFEVESWVASR